MKIDRAISYGLPRKIFEEKIQASKKTYAKIAGKFIDDLAKDEANELQAIKEKRLNTEKILYEEEEENTKLKATLEKLMRIREKNANLKQQIASMENGQKTSRQKQPSINTKLSQQTL
jgi:Mg2+ and Co2+ transporter CorA